jgi:phosphatidylserine synthase 2
LPALVGDVAIVINVQEVCFASPSSTTIKKCLCAGVLDALKCESVQFVDPTLGVPLAEREYGTDCRLWIRGEGLNTKVLKDTLIDEFVIAHTVGWWAKALIMRNYWLLWTCSIGFELMELTFQHWLPNFNECWWDSWLLDVLICNLGGLLAGMATVNYFGSKKYNWQGISKQKTLLAKTLYAIPCLTAWRQLKFKCAPFVKRNSA